MSVALSSIIIILLLLPSIFFRAFIIRSDSLENPLDTSIKTELGIIFFISIIQHIFGIFFINRFSFYNFDVGHLYKILIGDSKFVDFNVLRYSFIPFLIYILSQLLLSIVFAIFLKKLILSNYWDLRFNYFPISNEWDKLLSGRLFEYDRILKINNEISDLKEFRKQISFKIFKNDNSWFNNLKKFLKIYFEIRKEIKRN